MKAIKSVTEQPRISLKNSFDALSNDADNNKTARSETDLREFVFKRGKQGDHRQERLAASPAPSSDHVAPSLTSASDVPGERRVRGRRFLRGLAASAAPQCLPVDTLQNLEACPQLPKKLCGLYGISANNVAASGCQCHDGLCQTEKCDMLKQTASEQDAPDMVPSDDEPRRKTMTPTATATTTRTPCWASCATTWASSRSNLRSRRTEDLYARSSLSS